MIKITVPATSANLGIGYDTLGMAVSLYSHFTFERADKLTITGCPEEFQNENNLVYVSFVDALAAWGEPAFPRCHRHPDRRARRPRPGAPAPPASSPALWPPPH